MKIWKKVMGSVWPGGKGVVEMRIGREAVKDTGSWNAESEPFCLPGTILASLSQCDAIRGEVGFPQLFAEGKVAGSVQTGWLAELRYRHSKREGAGLYLASKAEIFSSAEAVIHCLRNARQCGALRTFIAQYEL